MKRRVSGMRMVQTAAAALVLCLLATGVSNAGAQPHAGAGPFAAFFPFCIDTHDSAKRTLEQQADMLASLGYTGMGHLWLDNLDTRLKTLDARGLKLYQITLLVSLDPAKAAYDARLKELLPLLEGRGVQLLLIVGGMAPSDPSGDARAVPVVQEMADLAAPHGVELLLYPHTGDWIERIEDAVRVAKQVDRPNVGVMFNLCHWLKVDGKQDLRGLLGAAMPLLRAVSIHGADTAEEVHAGTGNWIQPLGSGTYDVQRLLVLLQELGYAGPIGLQCWGIPGDTGVHLARSMAAWNAMIAKMPQKHR